MKDLTAGPPAIGRTSAVAGRAGLARDPRAQLVVAGLRDRQGVGRPRPGPAAAARTALAALLAHDSRPRARR